jgi:serine/threonine-protein kinase
MESVSRFRIVEPLGAGALGELFLSHDSHLGRPVALRVVDPAIAEDPYRREALLADARAARVFSHPNAANLLDIVEEGEGLYLVHDLAKGRSLAAVMTDGPLDTFTAVSLAAQLAEVLGAAGRAGLVHRAIDAAHVVVSAGNEAKLLDLGFSQWTRSGRAHLDAARALEGGGTGIARPSDAWYVSPEEVLGSPSDGRADVFSLGALFYQMLTGLPPFAADTLAATALKIVQARPAAPSSVNPAVPQAADAIALRALAKSLEARYPSADALAADLRALLVSLREPRPAEVLPTAGVESAAGAPTAELETESPARTAGAEPEAVPIAPVAAATPVALLPLGGDKTEVPGAEPAAVSRPRTSASPRSERAAGPASPRPAAPAFRAKLRWAGLGAAALVAILAAVGWFGRNALNLPWADPDPEIVPRNVMVMSFGVTGEAATPYFGPGFAEDLAARLSEVPGSTVVGRTSIRETSSSSDWRARARRLGAAVVVRGTVKPGPYALHADVELLDVETGASIWAQHFAREPRQVSSLQAEIAGQVAQQLRLVAPTGNRWARASVRTIDPAAYNLYLEGRDAADRRDRTRAIGLYGEALQRDPGLVEARASLSQALYLEEYYASGMREASAPGRALREAEAALAVDAELPAAHVAAALAAPTITTAASALSRALAYDPSNGEAWHHAGDLVAELDPPRSIPFYKASLALEPSIDANWRDLASAYAAAGNRKEAEEAVARGEAARPDRPWWRQMRARLQLEEGHFDAAAQSLSADPSVESTPIVWLMGRVVPFALAGRMVDARREAGRIADRYPSFCEGQALLAAVEIDAGAVDRGRQLAASILADASRPDAEPPLEVCAVLAAAATGDAAETASRLSRLAGNERALRLWTRQAIFGVGLSFRARWYPWSKVAGSQPMQVAASQLDESLKRLQAEVERRLPAPPGSTPPAR